MAGAGLEFAPLDGRQDVPQDLGRLRQLGAFHIKMLPPGRAGGGPPRPLPPLTRKGTP